MVQRKNRALDVSHYVLRQDVVVNRRRGGPCKGKPPPAASTPLPFLVNKILPLDSWHVNPEGRVPLHPLSCGEKEGFVIKKVDVYLYVLLILLANGYFCGFCTSCLPPVAVLRICISNTSWITVGVHDRRFSHGHRRHG